MVQLKVNLEETQAEFLDQFQRYGFPNKSAVVREALTRLYADMQAEQLRRSAALYAELYDEDEEIQDLTNVALAEWPE
jgi:Arc/MetJ-type ribon-helix-helix transcriptional regulator